ncbi:S-layer homology domain-containing protein [Paenibacillus glycanilyticus]|uniref:S-layer homology domain-containing protein n=1 Tax=Paenibacillus glycanilyticus TaxID=126569 RepID=UPI0020407249|nr:S-layer homology domain-containing protein [Paenibacillus glycanilyticus]MCM3628022.1 S-layer homology domain-containing protein [Paenibacillus glycanilyticus]
MVMNHRKKLVALAAAVMLTSSLPGAAFAESADKPAASAASGDAAASDGSAVIPVDVKVSKEKAESLARQVVSIPKEYALQGASLSADTLAGGKRSVWGLDFVYKVNGKTKGSIYVRLNADNGQLLDYSTYLDNPSAKPTYPLKVEREEAQKIAYSFLSGVAPTYKDQVKFNPEYGAQQLPPLTGEVRHTLRFDRIVNDIPYVDNYIELDVDSEGHVLRYSLQWDDTIKFPKVDAKLTADEAKKKLIEQAKPELRYLIPYNAQGPAKPILSYDMGAFAIDAVTGKEVQSGYINPNLVSDKPVSDKPLGDAPAAVNLTEEQAKQAVLAAFPLPSNAVFSGSSYYENTDESTGSAVANWRLDWELKNGKETAGSASATINSRTGMISSFYSYQNNPNISARPALSYDQAEAKAIDSVKKQLPWVADELYVVKRDQSQYDPDKVQYIDSYYFNFVHKINGATADYDNVSVTIDANTGVVRSYDASINPYKYPETAPKVITPAQAIEKWMTYYRTELTYYLTQNFVYQGQPIPAEKYKVLLAAGEIQPSDVQSNTDAQLIYRLVPRQLDESIFLDAQSGGWKNRETGDVTQLEKPKAVDIDGHWAERQLELMVAYKALDVKDGKVRPNQIVTRGELIKMLVLAMNSGRSPILYGASEDAAASTSFRDVGAKNQYYVYVESALQQNLIDIGDGSFNPDGKVDREEMAELIVRALGYNSLANYENLFNINFKDAGKMEKKGQAAIVVGLKIMTLSGGSFQPDKQVSRADASVAFFRFLQTRAELQEAPLRN